MLIDRRVTSSWNWISGTYCIYFDTETSARYLFPLICPNDSDFLNLNTLRVSVLLFFPTKRKQRSRDNLLDNILRSSLRVSRNGYRSWDVCFSLLTKALSELCCWLSYCFFKLIDSSFILGISSRGVVFRHQPRACTAPGSLFSLSIRGMQSGAIFVTGNRTGLFFFTVKGFCFEGFRGSPLRGRVFLGSVAVVGKSRREDRKNRVDRRRVARCAYIWTRTRCFPARGDPAEKFLARYISLFLSFSLPV